MMFAAFSALAFGRLVDKKSPYTEEQYWTMWKEFQDLPELADKRFYETAAEHDKRFDIFKSNMDLAYEHNQDETQTFTMGVTPFADLTHTEWLEYLSKSNGFRKPQDSLTVPHEVFDTAKWEDQAPDAVDWSQQGYVTPIKNQGQCGSCWAFSTTGGIEGQNFKKTNKLSSFSEQQLVDCSTAEGNQGCNGGLMDDGFQYVEDHGLCFESAYPYTGTDGGSCKASECTSQVTVSSFTDIPEGDTNALKVACGTQGPISIAVDATFLGWQLYNGGILKNCAKKLDHGVLLVGYNTDQAYWKVKNSWGPSWGEEGYIRLAAFDDTCGLADSASYPVL